MKTTDNPIKKVRRLTALMVIYFLLYLSAIALLIASAAAQNGALFLIFAAVCGATAIGLDVYVRAARAKLNASLQAELVKAGVDISKLNKGKKRRNE